MPKAKPFDLDEILTLGAWMNCHTGDPGPDFERRLRAADPKLVMLAAKLLAGRPYTILSDDPEVIRHARLLAERVGATTLSAEGFPLLDDDSDFVGTQTVVITPAPRQ
jgi:hypothetical protein